MGAAYRAGWALEASAARVVTAELQVAEVSEWAWERKKDEIP
jgi:hypothetical protein